ncbi:MAG TPA: hypothetical protein VM434_07265 [Beijerinckiaceae bacterium]|nr:hypothetical protein [Beijerinckiaceae bacterium]
MVKTLAAASVLAFSLAVAGSAFAASKNQGGGPGASGTGDKASGKTSFFATKKTGAAGPQGGGPGNSGTGDKNSNRKGVRLP